MGSGPNTRLSIYFGGTFDPPTRAHLAVANRVSQVFDCPVIWLPNAQSPLKSQINAGEHRIKMIQLLCQLEPRFELSRIDFDRPGPSYTVDTLEHLQSQASEQRLLWVMGADNFAQIQCWDRWPRLLELANLIVLNRPGHRIVPPAPWVEYQCRHDQVVQAPKGWCELELTPMDVAASQVRHAIQNHQAWEHWVPAPVIDYIKDNHLYVENNG